MSFNVLHFLKTLKFKYLRSEILNISKLGVFGSSTNLINMKSSSFQMGSIIQYQKYVMYFFLQDNSILNIYAFVIILHQYGRYNKKTMNAFVNEANMSCSTSLLNLYLQHDYLFTQHKCLHKKYIIIII